MPLWVAALLGGFVQATGTFVGRVLVSIGVGYVTFSGLDAALGLMRDQALAAFSGIGAVAVGVASVLQVGTAISIVSSALAARLLLDGLQGGTITKMIIKN